MKIERLVIRNFRGFENFALDVDRRSLVLIGENAGGKSSLLTAIVRALGRDLNFTRADFRDTGQPIEIEVTFSDFTIDQRGLYGDYIRFGPPATLVVGVRATWNDDAEEAEAEHHYPLHPGSRSRREERDGFPMQWLASWRDPSRMLRFGAPRSVMGRLLAALPLTASLDQAAADVRQAGEQLALDPALDALLRQARDRLAELLPDVAQHAFGMGLSTLTPHELLRQFELEVEHLGDPVPVSRQSGGIAQLSIFVFALQLAVAQEGTFLLIDEPEVSLHPQAQRALMRHLRMLDAQTIVATHSSNLLDRADPRTIVRLKRSRGAVAAVSPALPRAALPLRLPRHRLHAQDTAREGLGRGRRPPYQDRLLAGAALRLAGRARPHLRRMVRSDRDPAPSCKRSLPRLRPARGRARSGAGAAAGRLRLRGPAPLAGAARRLPQAPRQLLPRPGGARPPAGRAAL